MTYMFILKCALKLVLKKYPKHEMDRQIIITTYDIKILKICFKVAQLLQTCDYESCSDNCL